MHEDFKTLQFIWWDCDDKTWNYAKLDYKLINEDFCQFLVKEVKVDQLILSSQGFIQHIRWLVTKFYQRSDGIVCLFYQMWLNVVDEWEKALRDVVVVSSDLVFSHLYWSYIDDKLRLAFYNLVITE